MNTQKVMDTLEWLKNIEITSEEELDFQLTCVDLLYKQFPYTPLLIDGRMFCPRCRANQNSLNYYCDHCGQAIYWPKG